MITGKDFDELFVNICKELKDAPEYSPRGHKTKEIINANLLLENPKACILTNPHRKISKTYIGAEINWYLSGSNNIEGIKEYAKMWEQIADYTGKVNSAYGWQIFSQELPGSDNNQWDYIVRTLKNDKDSRQAIININQPIHKYETKDVPCTLTIQYLIRDDKLHSIVNMRSSDAIWGLGNDIPFFTFLQIKLHNKLLHYYPNLELGKYYHNSASLHTYERHYKMLENILEDNKKYKSESWSSNYKINALKCTDWKYKNGLQN